jgi:hypothetical protein
MKETDRQTETETYCDVDQTRHGVVLIASMKDGSIFSLRNNRGATDWRWIVEDFGLVVLRHSESSELVK